MKRAYLIAGCISLLLSSLISAQDFASYYERYPYLDGTPATVHDGLLGFANPASSQMFHSFNSRFYWTQDRTSGPGDIGGWGWFSAVSGLGFGMQKQEFNGIPIRDYNLSLAMGDEQSALGLGFTWFRGDEAFWNREKLFSVGFISRPSPFVSIGVSGHFSTETSSREAVAELGIRPLGDARFTLFGDAALQKRQRLSDAAWSAGVALEVVPGISLSGRYFESEAFTIGLSFAIGYQRLGGRAQFNAGQNHTATNYHIGFGDYRNSPIADLFSRNRHYVDLRLKGRVDYRTYRLFDDNTLRFKEILDNIDYAAKDPRIAAIALNLSALRVLPEHAWEIREALNRFRARGKKVVIFIDNAEMSLYHLASAADVLMLDPEGSIMLPGYVMGRTFLKGTLAKLGLAFDEWRFFEFKSAAEVLSRDDMSPADRQQRQDFIDDMYSLIRSDVSTSRTHITPQKFDDLINNNVFFVADSARELGLVDTLCRWEGVEEVIANLTDGKKRPLPLKLVSDRARASSAWGKEPVIAVVYAQGVCAMDEGINARRLNGIIRNLTGNNRVKAVVLRVDSPGGDGMASDVVAEALKECMERKPVVVSQGQLAASGGYWISMYSNRILAAPGTITGSIGVIGGWIYDAGISGKLGMTSDHVKIGDHADVGFGIRLPLLGISVPARNLTADERGQVKDIFFQLYDRFVKKVATGRGMSVEEVRAIGEGHFYSGTDGLSNGLVDELGGLSSAIEAARELAGLKADDEYEVIEVPRYKGFFDTGRFSPIGLEEKLAADQSMQFIRMVIEHRGRPIPMLRPGTYPVLD